MVTIKDVAQLAGVSISTVSNVLNESKYVSPELSEKVYDAVNKLGYITNTVASNMKKGYTRTIGVITSDICGLFYPYVLKGIYKVLDEYGYNLIICDTASDNKNQEKERSNFANLAANMVDGIIFVSNISEEKKDTYIEEIKKDVNHFKNTAMVSIERDFSEYGIDSIYYDNTEVGRIATSHLLDCGCKEVFHISGPSGEQIAEDRKMGFYEVLKKHKLIENSKEKYHISSNYTLEGGYEAAKKMYSMNNKIDGIYVANDQMALGVLEYLKEIEKSVPEQIKVIGTDNIFISSIIQPSLSTVQIEKIAMGELAANTLMDKILNKNNIKSVYKKKMEVNLIERQSTRTKNKMNSNNMGK